MIAALTRYCNLRLQKLPGRQTYAGSQSCVAAHGHWFLHLESVMLSKGDEID